MNLIKLATIIGTLPNQIANGQTADAVPLMADLNWIVSQVNANAAELSNTALLNAANSFTMNQSGPAASAPANFVIASQVQNSSLLTLSSTLGTNTVTGRVAQIAISAYTPNQIFTFFPAQTNTGPASLNIDAVGSSIIFSMGSTLVGGELRGGAPATVVRDGSRFNLLDPANVRIDLASATAVTNVRVLIAYTPAPIVLGKQASRTVLTSGSGTYTPPAGCTRINVRLVGGGGGGSATITNNGTTGGDTTFGGMTGSGGVGGVVATNGGAGGAAAGGDINIAGGDGTGATQATSATVAPNGGPGGASAFGGNGGGGTTGADGLAGATNSGGGGGGAGGDATTNGGAGGGSGGYVEKLIPHPVPTAYAVGASGAGGAAGNHAGGAGGSGIIIIDEYFN